MPDTNTGYVIMKSVILKKMLFVFLCLSAIFITSCSKTEADINDSVVGEAVATPSIVKNGDTIELSIAGFFSSSSYISINGEEYYPIVHYLIDGNEVATSSEKQLPFNAEYKVTNLSVGEHTLSVNITSSNKDAYYTNSVTTSKITVTE